MLEVNRAVLESVTPRSEGEVDSASEILSAVRIAKGARVMRSRIVGPTVIDAVPR